MRRWIKRGAIVIAFITILYMLQYQFISKESWTIWSLPLSGKVIVLDPGHGGQDGGAISRAGAVEKELTLAISKKLRDYLQQSGALVLMTREDDYDLAEDKTKRLRQRKVEDLQKRVSLINDSNADLFISIHMNAIPSPRWYGAQTFFARTFSENESLAKFVQDEIRRNLENTTREAKPIQAIYLLKHANIPGVLVEAGFLSNPNEAAQLESEMYQEKIAASIYQGIMRFYAGEEEIE